MIEIKQYCCANQLVLSPAPMIQCVQNQSACNFEYTSIPRTTKLLAQSNFLNVNINYQEKT
jgi:hypothetical protein